MRDYKKMSAHFLLRSYLSCNRARLFGMVVAVLCGVTHRKGTTSTLVILWGQIWGVFLKSLLGKQVNLQTLLIWLPILFDEGPYINRKILSNYNSNKKPIDFKVQITQKVYIPMLVDFSLPMWVYSLMCSEVFYRGDIKPHKMLFSCLENQ